MKNFSRREFVQTSGTFGIGLTFASKDIIRKTAPGKRIGLIGLDSSHCINFTKALNTEGALPEYRGYKVTAAYPQGSLDIQSSVSRIAGYTEDVKKMGVEITGSLQELIDKSDVLYMITNDGRRHLEQALPVFRAGKRMFIDKPMAASLKDAIAIFNAAEYYKVPVWSCSGMRFRQQYIDLAKGSAGKIIGADIYGPSPMEKTHPTLFWYGIHPVESLCTIMGTGCESVSRTFSDMTDVSVGTWPVKRIGTVRALRNGTWTYGGNAYSEKNVIPIEQEKYPDGYNPLFVKMIEFFDTGVVPVTREQTQEVLAFMEAADLSLEKNGSVVTLEYVMSVAAKEAMKMRI